MPLRLLQTNKSANSIYEYSTCTYKCGAYQSKCGAEARVMGCRPVALRDIRYVLHLVNVVSSDDVQTDISQKDPCSGQAPYTPHRPLSRHDGSVTPFAITHCVFVSSVRFAITKSQINVHLPEICLIMSPDD